MKDQIKKLLQLSGFPEWIFLVTMISLLTLALLRAFFAHAELIVAWAGDGSLPAVCYHASPDFGQNYYLVLCPGSGSSALQLLFALEKRGCSELACIVSSTAAPSPRGARILLHKKRVTELLLLAETRPQLFWQNLASEAKYAGVGLHIFAITSPNDTVNYYPWKIHSKRGKNGEMFWSFYLQNQPMNIELAWLKTGELQLQWRDHQGKRGEQYFPRSNRGGIWEKTL